MARKKPAPVPRGGRKRTTTSVSAAITNSSAMLAAPPSGVTIRMYRQGHGDCFLLAFRKSNGTPFYLLIDCGMKKGSDLKSSMKMVAENIRDATGGHLDLVVVTHEHEDHVSGFLSEREVFDNMMIDQLWLAWTEDPQDDLAIELRKKYKDTLLGLVSTLDRLKEIDTHVEDRAHKTIKSLLGFELSDDDRRSVATIKGRTNKEGILVVKRRADAKDGTQYLNPHMPPLPLRAVPGVRVFVLGPPRDAAKLRDMDPVGDEEFHLALGAAVERSFFAALADGTEAEAHQPFDTQYRIPLSRVSADPHAGFFENSYGQANSSQAWRRIDTDWMQASESFALRMNSYVNNTSLVLAFELPAARKVLLFVGDAQRGNWVSWADQKWTNANGLADGDTIAAGDLLARTVFYKVGHHGSHNATLNKGGLKEMAQGVFRDQFVAMIPANEKWATTANDPPWMHPLAKIYQALLEKAKGRVFVMDRPLSTPSDDVLSKLEWEKFSARSTFNDIYYEYTVADL